MPAREVPGLVGEFAEGGGADGVEGVSAVRPERDRDDRSAGQVERSQGPPVRHVPHPERLRHHAAARRRDAVREPGAGRAERHQGQGVGGDGRSGEVGGEVDVTGVVRGGAGGPAPGGRVPQPQRAVVLGDFEDVRGGVGVGDRATGCPGARVPVPPGTRPEPMARWVVTSQVRQVRPDAPSSVRPPSASTRRGLPRDEGWVTPNGSPAPFGIDRPGQKGVPSSTPVSRPGRGISHTGRLEPDRERSRPRTTPPAARAPSHPPRIRCPRDLIPRRAHRT